MVDNKHSFNASKANFSRESSSYKNVTTTFINNDGGRVHIEPGSKESMPVTPSRLFSPGTFSVPEKTPKQKIAPKSSVLRSGVGGTGPSVGTEIGTSPEERNRIKENERIRASLQIKSTELVAAKKTLIDFITSNGLSETFENIKEVVEHLNERTETITILTENATKKGNSREALDVLAKEIKLAEEELEGIKNSAIDEIKIYREEAATLKSGATTLSEDLEKERATLSLYKEFIPLFARFSSLTDKVTALSSSETRDAIKEKLKALTFSIENFEKTPSQELLRILSSKIAIIEKSLPEDGNKGKLSAIQEQAPSVSTSGNGKLRPGNITGGKNRFIQSKEGLKATDQTADKAKEKNQGETPVSTSTSKASPFRTEVRSNRSALKNRVDRSTSSLPETPVTVAPENKLAQNPQEQLHVLSEQKKELLQEIANLVAGQLSGGTSTQEASVRIANLYVQVEEVEKEMETLSYAKLSELQGDTRTNSTTEKRTINLKELKEEFNPDAIPENPIKENQTKPDNKELEVLVNNHGELVREEAVGAAIINPTSRTEELVTVDLHAPETINSIAEGTVEDTDSNTSDVISPERLDSDLNQATEDTSGTPQAEKFTHNQTQEDFGNIVPANTLTPAEAKEKLKAVRHGKVNDLLTLLVKSVTKKRELNWRIFAVPAVALAMSLGKLPESSSVETASTQTLLQKASWKDFLQSPEDTKFLSDFTALSFENLMKTYAPSIKIDKSNPSALAALSAAECEQLLNNQNPVYGYNGDQREQACKVVRMMEKIVQATDAHERMKSDFDQSPYTYADHTITVYEFYEQVRRIAQQATDNELRRNKKTT